MTEELTPRSKQFNIEECYKELEQQLIENPNYFSIIDRIVLLDSYIQEKFLKESIEYISEDRECCEKGIYGLETEFHLYEWYLTLGVIALKLNLSLSDFNGWKVDSSIVSEGSLERIKKWLRISSEIAKSQVSLEIPIEKIKSNINA